MSDETEFRRASSVRRRHRMGGTLGLVTVAALAPYAGSVLPVFYEQLKAYLAIGNSAYGLMLSVGSLGGVLTTLAGGVLVDRLGPRRIIRVCLLGLALSMALIVFSGRSWIIMTAALGIGALFQSTCYMAVNAYLVRLFPDRKRTMLALNAVVISAAGMAFPALAQALLALINAVPTISFSLVLHAPFAVLAMLLLAGALFFRGGADIPGGPGPARPWSWRDLHLPPRTLSLVLLAALHGAVDTALYIWIPAYLLSHAFQAQPIPPGWVLAGTGAAYLVSRAALMLVPEHFGRRAFLILPGLLGGGALLVGICSHNYLITAGGYVLGSLLWSVEFPTILSLIAEEEGPRFGTAIALVSLGTAVGTFGLVNETAWLVDRLGDGAMWKAMLLLGLGFPCFSVGAAVWLWIGRGRRLEYVQGAAGESAGPPGAIPLSRPGPAPRPLTPAK